MAITHDGFWGLAKAEKETGVYEYAILVNHNPPPVTESVQVGQNTTLEPGSVVTYDPATQTMALAGATSTPFGVLMSPVNTGVGETTAAVVWRVGNFNLSRLIFDPAVTTDDAKKAILQAATPPAQLFASRAPDGSNIQV